VLPLIPLVHPVKFKLVIPVYEICSVPIVITPLVANPVTEATPIVATVAFIPAHTAGDTYSIIFEFIKYYE